MTTTTTNEPKKTPMNERDLVFLDLETTGLDPDVHEIIQIAAYMVSPTRREECAFKAYVWPKQIELAEAKALEVNGYSEERWRQAGAVHLVEALQGLQASCFAHDSVTWAWNPTFDKPFLRRAFITWLGALPKTLDYHWLDVASMAWPLATNRDTKLDTVKLVKVAEYFGISTEGAHDAGRDVEMMVEVYKKIVGWPLGKEA